MAGLGPPANRGSERANTRSWRLGGTEVGTAAQGTAPRCCSTSSGPATPTTIITPNRGRCFPSALDARRRLASIIQGSGTKEELTASGRDSLLQIAGEGEPRDVAAAPIRPGGR